MDYYFYREVCVFVCVGGDFVFGKLKNIYFKHQWKNILSLWSHYSELDNFRYISGHVVQLVIVQIMIKNKKAVKVLPVFLYLSLF